MQMYDLIQKKKEGKSLSKEEIDWMIAGYTKGDIADYQMSAMTMAICFQGMDARETGDLTLAMRDSGACNDLSAIPGIKLDKHSTGGVGDKTSIALLPLVSCLGVKIAKMSGRGLGHTGGTIDKLESIPGFCTGLSKDRFFAQVGDIGLALIGQTAELAPADKKLYALRDVTATVDQLSLIASSIMSKKLAAGADAIVLDVKCGSGAFMKNFDDASSLAREMVAIGRHAGKKTMAIISNMDEPLGYAVGNALEVKEAIDTLFGRGPKDFTKLVYALGSRMLMLGGIAESAEEAEDMLKAAIEDGRAIKQLKRFISAQGGNERCVDDRSILPQAPYIQEVTAETDAYVQRIDCAEVGLCSLMLGAGRERIEDKIDAGAGIILHKKCGDKVKAGDILAELHYSDASGLKAAKERLLAAYHFGEKEPGVQQVILGVVE